MTAKLQLQNYNYNNYNTRHTTLLSFSSLTLYLQVSQSLARSEIRVGDKNRNKRIDAAAYGHCATCDGISVRTSIALFLFLSVLIFLFPFVLRLRFLSHSRSRIRNRKSNRSRGRNKSRNRNGKE